MKLDYEPWAKSKHWERAIRRVLKWQVGVLLLVLLVFTAASCVHGLSYEHTEELDLQSGRLRTSQYILFVRINRTVQETAFSMVLPAAMKDAGPADWHRVHTRDCPCFSTHCYVYGGAMSRIQMMGNIWPALTPEAREQVAATTLWLWRSGGPRAGYEYIDEVARMAFDTMPARRRMGVDRLPTTKPADRR